MTSPSPSPYSGSRTSRLTEDEWERGIALCLQARVLGRWYGDDILHPIPMTEQMNKYIDRWRAEQCLCRINAYLAPGH